MKKTPYHVMAKSSYRAQQLGYINDAARVGLVEQRFPVVAVIRDGIVEDRKPFIFLGMSEFNDLDIAGLTVLIGRIIGNIDLILLLFDRVPFVLERNTVFH